MELLLFEQMLRVNVVSSVAIKKTFLKRRNGNAVVLKWVEAYLFKPQERDKEGQSELSRSIVDAESREIMSWCEGCCDRLHKAVLTNRLYTTELYAAGSM